MFCKKCGLENTTGAKFCKRCGAPLRLPEKPKKKRGKLIALVTSLVLVLGACGGVFAFWGEIQKLFIDETKTYIEANDNIQECITGDTFLNANTDDRKKLAEEMLQDLEDKEQIEAGSITYSESGFIYFNFINGGEGVISLLDPDDSVIGSSTSPFYYKNNEGEIVEKEDYRRIPDFKECDSPYLEGNKTALIIYGLEFKDSKKNTEEQKKEWDKCHLQTTLVHDFTVQQFKTELANYDFISIRCHGSIDTGLKPDIATPMIVTTEVFGHDIEKYILDLGAGRVGAFYSIDGGTYHIKPEFFSYYYNENRLDGKIIWISSCNGYKNDKLVKSFAKCGADAVIGATEKVYVTYESLMCDEFVYNLLCGKNVKNALLNAKKVHGENDGNDPPAEFKIYDQEKAGEVYLFTLTKEGSEILAQNTAGTISGRIIDADGEPIVSAEVTASASISDTIAKETTLTDMDGYYHITCAPGNYRLTVMAEGYEEYNSTGYYNVETQIDTVVDTITMTPITPTPEIVQAILDNPTALQEKAEYWDGSYGDIFGYSGGEQIWFQDMDMDGDLECILFSGQVGTREMWDHEFCVYDTDSDGSLHYYQITHQDVADTAMCSDNFYQLYQDTTTGSYHYLKKRNYSVGLAIIELILEKHTADYDFGSGDMPILEITNADTITGSADYIDSHFVGTGPELRFNPSTTLSSLDEIVAYHNSYFENYVGFATTTQPISLSEYLAMTPEEQKSALMESYNAWSYEEDNSIPMPFADWIEAHSTIPPAFTQSQLESIARDLGVPDDLTVSFTQGEPSYWEAGGRWLTFVHVYHDGEVVAFVNADSYTGELIREIWVYSPPSDSEATIPTSAQVYNDHSYMLYESEDITTWDQAKAYCEDLGGHLAIISSQEENDFLYQYITDLGYQSAYFGLTDVQEEGTWLCVDGSTPSYTNWHSGEPNSENNNEDYAMFYYKFTDATWNDGDFANKTVSGGRAFLCEWDLLAAQ